VYATGRSSRAAGRSEIGRPETIEDTGDLLAAAGGQGTALVVDHEDPTAVAALVARIEAERGRLDVLVNDIFGGDRYAQWHTPLWEHDLAGGLRMLRMVRTPTSSPPMPPCRCCCGATAGCWSR
jgi:NAD(P)-dependent dehydrogenase (short-subunit alcohol dehydrogenase family)